MFQAVVLGNIDFASQFFCLPNGNIDSWSQYFWLGELGNIDSQSQYFRVGRGNIDSESQYPCPPREYWLSKSIFQVGRLEILTLRVNISGWGGKERWLRESKFRSPTWILTLRVNIALGDVGDIVWPNTMFTSCNPFVSQNSTARIKIRTHDFEEIMASRFECARALYCKFGLNNWARPMRKHEQACIAEHLRWITTNNINRNTGKYSTTISACH